MLNRVELLGRLTRDVELRKTPQNKSVAKFTLAVDRKYKREGGQNTDFINCVAWEQSADYLAKYSHKGDVVGVDGSIQTGKYEGKSGTIYTTDVIAEYVCIVSTKKKDEDADEYEPPIPEKKVANAVKVGQEWIKEEDLPFY